MSAAVEGTASSMSLEAASPPVQQPAAPREDLVANAVKFLRDPKVQTAPLAKRLAFLETKGMTSAEIEAALARATMMASNTAAVASDLPPLPPKDLTAAYPTAAMTYGAFLLVENYIKPLMIFPTSAVIKADTERIETQLGAASQSVDLVRVQTLDVIKAIESNADDLQKSLTGMAETIKSLEDADEKRDGQIDRMDQEMASIKAMVVKMTDRSKDHQDEVLTELQNELKSLKSLLLNRRIAIGNTAAPCTSSQPGPNAAQSHEATSGSVGQTSLLPTHGATGLGSDTGVDVELPVGSGGRAVAAETYPVDTMASSVSIESGFVKNLLSNNTKPAIPCLAARRSTLSKR
ncbi:hypothetical protein BASA61_003650 [Batrachochytrium salamandrivorans]|nr:hypothetical protein BASA61_003650 [Batrachochytrium salamandrivorans]